MAQDLRAVLRLAKRRAEAPPITTLPTHPHQIFGVVAEVCGGVIAASPSVPGGTK